MQERLDVDNSESAILMGVQFVYAYRNVEFGALNEGWLSKVTFRNKVRRLKFVL